MITEHVIGLYLIGCAMVIRRFWCKFPTGRSREVEIAKHGIRASKDMVPDFSHVRTPLLSSYLDYMSRGRRLTDEMLAAAVRTLQPPLFRSLTMSQLYRQLTGPRKRGRPLGDRSTRKELARRIAKLTRVDFPASLREALVKRLRSGEPYTEQDRALGAYPSLHRRRCHSAIKSLYPDFYDLLGGPEVSHPILGSRKLPLKAYGRSRSDQATIMTQEALGELFDYGLSLGRIRNIVSEKSRRKNVSSFRSKSA